MESVVGVDTQLTRTRVECSVFTILYELKNFYTENIPEYLYLSG